MNSSVIHPFIILTNNEHVTIPLLEVKIIRMLLSHDIGPVMVSETMSSCDILKVTAAI